MTQYMLVRLAECQRAIAKAWSLSPSFVPSPLSPCLVPALVFAQEMTPLEIAVRRMIDQMASYHLPLLQATSAKPEITVGTGLIPFLLPTEVITVFPLLTFSPIIASSSRDQCSLSPPSLDRFLPIFPIIARETT